MKIGNYIFQKVLYKHSFHIPNWKWLRNIVKKLFTIRATRGRGKRTSVAKKLGLHPRRFDDVLPIKYATRLHIYLPDIQNNEKEYLPKTYYEKKALELLNEIIDTSEDLSPETMIKAKYSYKGDLFYEIINFLENNDLRKEEK